MQPWHLQMVLAHSLYFSVKSTVYRIRYPVREIRIVNCGVSLLLAANVYEKRPRPKKQYFETEVSCTCTVCTLVLVYEDTCSRTRHIKSTSVHFIFAYISCSVHAFLCKTSFTVLLRISTPDEENISVGSCSLFSFVSVMLVLHDFRELPDRLHSKPLGNYALQFQGDAR